jgi:hypothetical protein
MRPPNRNTTRSLRDRLQLAMSSCHNAIVFIVIWPLTTLITLVAWPILEISKRRADEQEETETKARLARQV